MGHYCSTRIVESKNAESVYRCPVCCSPEIHCSIYYRILTGVSVEAWWCYCLVCVRHRGRFPNSAQCMYLMRLRFKAQKAKDVEDVD